MTINENRNKKTAYRGSKRSLVVNLTLIVMIALFTGFSIGMWMAGDKVDPNLYNIDASKLYDNIDKIKADANGKKPSELGAVKSCVLAFDTTFNYKNLTIKSIGKVNAMGVTQSINSRVMRDNDKIFSETVSVSKFVKAADRFYLENGAINHVKGKINSNFVEWNGMQENLTISKYKENMGGGINEYMLYIVSSKTVTKSSNIETLENGNYKFTINLDKVSSVIHYVKSMKTTGGLSSYPVFQEDVKLTITIDSNYRILQAITNEKYTAKKSGIPIAAESIGELTHTFTYDNDNIIIPPINENTNF